MLRHISEFLPKASRLSPASARGFFDVPSLNAAPHSGDLLSGNLGEGASKNLFSGKDAGSRLFVSGFYVIPGQSALECSKC